MSTKSRSETLAACVTVLAETFRQPLSDGAFEGYRLALEDLSASEVQHATKRALREGKFMPSPSELRALAGIVPVETQAALAWEACQKAVATVGWNHHVDFGPLVNAVVRNLGGWLAFCEISDAAAPFERKRFEEVFVRFARVPAETLNGDLLKTTLDIAEVRRVPIRGLPQPTTAKQLEAANGSGNLRAVVHQLADAKSAGAGS